MGKGTSIAEWASTAGPRETTYQFVQRVLRNALLNGQLEGGTRLPQTEIARQLGISTTPVREALRELASEGLIDSAAGRAPVVHNLTLDEWREIVLLKRQLEPLAIRLAARRVCDEILVALTEAHEAMIGAETVAAYVDGNRTFHRICHEASGSPRLKGILETLQDAEAAYVAKGIREHPEIIEQGHKHHAAIIELLHARDVTALEQVVVQHAGITLAPFAAGAPDGSADGEIPL